jgi:hypothetical protein
MFYPDLASLLTTIAEQSERNVGVALPGTVVSYNAGKQTCSVDPGVHRLVPSEEDEDLDEIEALPTIQDVPVIWPQGRNFNIVGTLSKGDPVLLVCMDRDPSGWMRTGDPAEPDDARTHHWSSAVAIPGLVPDRNPFPSPSDAAALASVLATIIGELRTVLNTVAAGLTVPLVPPPFLPDDLLPATIKLQIASKILKLAE